jgi:hypothetical protein
MPGKIGTAFESPLMQSLSAGIGFLGFMIGKNLLTFGYSKTD